MAERKLAVFAINSMPGRGSIWVKAGTAVRNKDESLSVYLDVLPLNGQLHIREQKDFCTCGGGRGRGAPCAIHAEGT